MKSISWLVPTLLEGSGGHRTILEHAAFLQDEGYKTKIYLEGWGGWEKSGLTPSELIKKLFGVTFADIEIGWDIKPCDMVVATIWYSALHVAKLPFACRKIYFVQDYEAWFQAVNSGYMLAQRSYHYGLEAFTIGRGLAKKLQSEGVGARFFDFGVNTDIYRPMEGVRDWSKPQVCFIYQPDKSRRCWDLGISALKIVKAMRPDVSIKLYGSSKYVSPKIPDCFHHRGLLSLDACSRLYNESTVGLCFSSTNPSRVPFEMMATGLPVVDIYGENNIYDLPSDAVMLSYPEPENVALSILSLLNDAQRSKEMSDKAVDFIKHRNQLNEKRMFKDGIEGGENFIPIIESLSKNVPVDYFSLEEKPILHYGNFRMKYPYSKLRRLAKKLGRK